MDMLTVPFGLRGDELFSPCDVKRGLSCNCTCPGCGARLVANHPKSPERRKYFSHLANTGCSTGYESALHLAAKQVLQKTKRVLVPSISATITLYDKETQAEAAVSKYIGEKEVALESVAQEVREFSGVVPDIVASAGGRLILIEIAVTHFVDDEKLAKLKQLGHPVMEIYLDPENAIPSMDEIEKLVTSSSHNRSWLINSKCERLYDAARAEAEEELGKAKERVFLIREKTKENHESYLRLTDSQKIATELDLLNSSLDELVSLEDVKTVIGRRVTGDNSFGVSSRVWQLFVYREFVHNNQGNDFHADDVLDAISGRFRVESVFNEAPQIAIHYYLKFLSEKGMLERSYAKSYSVVKDITGNELPF